MMKIYSDNRSGLLSGYAGRDNMREEAERLIKPKMRGFKITQMESLSSPDRQYTLPFKKGGKVKSHHLTKMQTDMYKPKVMKGDAKREKLEGLSVLKRGGRPHAKSKNKGKYGYGGFVGSALGGLAGAGLGALTGGWGAVPGALTGAEIGGKIGGYLPFKKGGKVHQGRNSKHQSAQPCKKKSTSHFGNGGIVMKKMAIGGVGKIRHKEATASGMPIKRRGK